MKCPRHSTRRVVGEIVERLMVELKQLVRAVRPDRCGKGVGIRAAPCLGGLFPIAPTWSTDISGGVGPAARIPGPIDTVCAQLVADRDIHLGDVVGYQGREPARVGRAWRVRL